jgi:hypothetical protein
MILPASPLSTLRYDPSRDHRQDSRPEWIRFSFSVGLSHPLQCAGLSRRSLSPVFVSLLDQHRAAAVVGQAMLAQNEVRELRRLLTVRTPGILMDGYFAHPEGVFVF